MTELPWWAKLLPLLFQAAKQKDHIKELCEPESPEDQHPKAPQGLGLTFVNLRALGSVENTVKRVKGWGFSWVKLLLDSNSGQAVTTFPDYLPDYVAAFRQNDIRVTGWAYPVPSREKDNDVRHYGDRVMKEAQRLDITTFCHNTEKHFRGRDSQMVPLFKHTRDGFLSQGGSIYGNPRILVDLDKAAEHVDFIQPQWYTTVKQELYLKMLREMGYERIIPVIGASSKHSAKSTLERFRNTPHDGGVNFWNETHMRGRRSDFERAVYKISQQLP